MTVVDRVRERFRATLAGASGRAPAAGALTRLSLASFLLKGVSMALLFVYGLVLARLLGSEQFGVYEYAFAWLTLLLVPAVFGLDKILLRSLAASRARGAWREARGLLRWSTRTVAASSLMLALAAAAVAWFTGGRRDVVVAFLMVCLALPLSALTVLWEGGLRGLHRVIEGQLPIPIVRPVLAIVLLVVAVRLSPLPATATTALGAFFTAALAAMAMAGLRLYRALPDGLTSVRPEYRPRAWLGAALPLAVMAALYIVNGRLGIILLGSMVDPEAAGIFALANRGADLIQFPMIAVHTALSPTFASLYASGDIVRLQRVVTRGTLLMFGLSFPVAVLLFVFGEQFLLLFGASFTVGLDALRILVAGQCVNTAMGSVGVLLVMTNRERLAMAGFGAGAAINVGLALWLIPWLGVEGAAIAAVTSIVVWNVVLAVITHRAIGVDTTVVGPTLRWFRRLRHE